MAAYNEPPLYAKLAKLAPDLVISCGFPRRASRRASLERLQCGAVNVHPALLLLDRGPLPLFWCFRRGDTDSGVTLHVLSPGLDEGAIIAQRHVPVPRRRGGRGIFCTARHLRVSWCPAQLPALLSPPWSTTVQGASNAWSEQAGAQRIGKSNRQQWNAAADLWHFIRGARAFGDPWARLMDDIYYFDDALAAHPGMHVPGDFILIGNEMLLRVQDGAVRLRVT